ncbi:acyl-CoA dehydrogenase family protein [Streptomyces sp. NBC_01497]|uniref:acyl-CoA dehydrogenase family protein n=1 Tax=Streptomyces sp. NBC_01497 TaxID=2903885 RepID=UPI002E3773AB|nr:acyl-CoA dehydrogenase family protein [Streptomyces sp. NBC_01497]
MSSAIERRPGDTAESGETMGGADDFWLRVGRELADDLAVDAVERDRAGKPPYDEMVRVRESGLLAALAPPDARGFGMGWRTACAVVRRIAAADGSMGELLGRHYVLSWSARFFAGPERAAEWEADARKEQWLWAGDTGTTRPHAFARDTGTGPSLIRAARRGGGGVLRGSRTVASAVTLADRLVLNATADDTGEPLVVCVAPGDAGILREAAHDRLGQRLTDAGTVHFDEVATDAEAVLGPFWTDEDVAPPFTMLASAALRLMLTHVALGIAEGALAEAGDLSRAEARRLRAVEDPGGPLAATDGDVLLAFGSLALDLHSASAVVDRATTALADSLREGRKLDEERRTGTAVLVAAAEAVTVPAALRTGEGVLGLGEAEGLDRFWRDLRTLVGRVPAGHALRVLGEYYLSGDLGPATAGG